MTFLQRVLELTIAMNVTKNKLLTDTGLNKNSFVDWERRGTVPGGDVVSKLADYFHVSTDYLLGRTDDPSPVGEEKGPAPVAEGGLRYPPEYDLLDPEDQALIDSMIRRLILEKNQGDASSPSNGAESETA